MVTAKQRLLNFNIENKEWKHLERSSNPSLNGKHVQESSFFFFAAAKGWSDGFGGKLYGRMAGIVFCGEWMDVGELWWRVDTLEWSKRSFIYRGRKGYEFDVF